ncbi:hypothetical protein AVEN_179526-1 [Araneus ventricosus]|uniref:Uncharacterized protein n=1 Tax=Araneus ventricosus TaxID=182803 RepID=A0A4Y2P0T8_ARAVE|nr:hypothetical protein AVEN_179526-1 [Araneus ventricosus]
MFRQHKRSSRPLVRVAWLMLSWIKTKEVSLDTQAMLNRRGLKHQRISEEVKRSNQERATPALSKHPWSSEL